MFAIDDEKLPPPSPAVAAHASRTQNWVVVSLLGEPAARHEEGHEQRRDQQQRRR